MNKLTILILFFILFITHQSFSQINPNAPYEKFGNAHLSKELTAKIIDGLTNDSSKVLAIYSWIVENISYDSLSAEKKSNPLNETSRDINNTKPLFDCSEILTTKKTLGLGYAYLFSSMCNNIGIKNNIIRGFARLDSFEVDSPNHAWEAFKSAGKWYLADPTWDANVHIPGHSISDENPYFFLMTEPEVFLVSHFPLDPLWQFRTSPLTLKSWNAYIDDSDSLTSYFNYADSLKQYESNSVEKNFLGSMNRIIRAKDFAFMGHLEYCNFLTKTISEETTYYHELTQKLNNGNKNIEEMAKKMLPRKKELFNRLSRIESNIALYIYHLGKLRQFPNQLDEPLSINAIATEITNFKNYREVLAQERISLESTMYQLELLDKKPAVTRKKPK